MVTTDTGNPRVFISYSHDSENHKRGVLELANRLRSNGVECNLDQYELSPPEGWPRWMERQVRSADFVLVVCSEVYERRFESNEAAGKGLGATWEGAIITLALYESQGRNTKFLPVLLTPRDAKHIPFVLRSATRYVLDSENGYWNLYRRLTNQPKVTKPPLGELVALKGGPRAAALDVSALPSATVRESSIVNQAQILLSRGEVNQALEILDKCVDLQEDLTAICWYLFWLMDNQRLARAKEVLHSARKMAELSTVRVFQVSVLMAEAMIAVTEGRYLDGASLSEAAIAVTRDVLGSEQLETARVMAYFGGVHQRLGRDQQAETLYHSALDIIQRNMGTEDPDVATLKNNLAGLYRERAEYAKAEALYLEVLKLRERVIGSDHPSVAETLDGLALTYLEVGRFTDAESLITRALNIREEKQASVGLSLMNLGSLHAYQLKWRQAEDVLSQALSTEEVQSDPHHFVTVLNNLGHVQRKQRNYVEARRNFMRAAKSAEYAFGNRSPSLASCLDSLGLMSGDEGKTEEAEVHHRRALEIYSGVDEAHPGKTAATNNLAAVLISQQKLLEAEALLKGALHALEGSGVSVSRGTAAIHNNLGHIYVIQQRYELAARSFRRSIRVYEQLYGPLTPLLRAPIEQLLFVLAKTKNEKEVSRYERRLALIMQDHVRNGRLGP